MSSSAGQRKIEPVRPLADKTNVYTGDDIGTMESIKKMTSRLKRKSEKLASEKAVAENMYIQQSGESVKLMKALKKERDEKKKLLDENRNLQDTLQKQKLRYEKAYECQKVNLKRAEAKIDELQGALDRERLQRKHDMMKSSEGHMKNADGVGEINHQIPIEAVEEGHIPDSSGSRRSSMRRKDGALESQRRTSGHAIKKQRKSSEFNMTETLSVMFGVPISSGNY